MIQVYTDGGCIPNPGYGAGGFVVVKDNEVIHKESGKEISSTNNRMEMLAVINGLDWVLSNGYSNYVVVFTDSKYVKDGINEWVYTWIINGWKTSNKKSVKNKLLWEKLYDFKENKFSGLLVEWVKGHDGNEYNEMADSLCTNELVEVYGEFDFEKDKVKLKKIYNNLISSK